MTSVVYANPEVMKKLIMEMQLIKYPEASKIQYGEADLQRFKEEYKEQLNQFSKNSFDIKNNEK